MGVCLCARHGRQPILNACAHLQPGPAGTSIMLMGGLMPALVCPACEAEYSRDGAVIEELEQGLASTLRAWCSRCWRDPPDRSRCR